jgi:hypothetical protein
VKLLNDVLDLEEGGARGSTRFGVTHVNSPLSHTQLTQKNVGSP